MSILFDHNNLAACIWGEQAAGGRWSLPPWGVFIPNPKDVAKSKEYFSIPLLEITGVDSGWASLTVYAGGQKYKFGGMRKTKEWAEEAISNVVGTG